MSDNNDLSFTHSQEGELPTPESSETRNNGERQTTAPPTLTVHNPWVFGKIGAGIPSARRLFKRPVPPATVLLPAPTESIEESDEPRDITQDVAKWTLRRDIPLAILAWTGVALLFFWLVSHVIQTLLLLIIAALLAYAFAPLVKVFERVMPRFVAVLIVYLVVLTGVGFLLYLVVSSAVAQITSLTHTIQVFTTSSHPGQLTPLERFLRPFGISSVQIAGARDQLVTQLGGVAGSILPLLTGIAGALLDVVLIIILSIYFLFDGSKVVSWLRRDVPRSQRSRVGFFLTTMQRVVGGYIRGQLLMSTLIGVLVGVGMFFIGVPYALLLGVLAFILEFIPILGTLTSGVICVLLALTKGWVFALIVLLYFIVVHVIEGDVVGPRVMGKAVGLHPIVSIAALIAGAELFGIGGALFASPVAGIIQAVIVTLWLEWRVTRPDEFRTAKQRPMQTVESHPTDSAPDPAQAEKLLS